MPEVKVEREVDHLEDGVGGDLEVDGDGREVAQ